MPDGPDPGPSTGRVAANSAHIRPWTVWEMLGATVMLFVAAALRIRHLGYSDFQGDEARAMLMAARLVQSRDPEVLLLHKKGPLEVLLPAVGMLFDQADALTARLPFALAGLAAVLMLYLLARRWTGPIGALVAGGILAVDGYMIAFSRIVQYQSFVALSSIAAVAVTAFGPGSIALRATLAGAMIGAGTWAHYEAVFALPPVVLLLLAARSSYRSAVKSLAALAAGLALVAGLFYLPFVLNPNFAETWNYIADRRVGGGLLYNNLADFFNRASFYNASYYVMALALLAITAVALKLAALGRPQRSPGTSAKARGTARSLDPTLLVAATWLVAVAVALALPNLFVVHVAGRDLSLVALVFAIPGALLIFAPGIDPRWKAALAWFLGPFLAAGFLVTKPHTHFYTMLPGLALLIGWAVEDVVRNVGRSRDRSRRNGSAQRRWTVALWATGAGAAALAAALLVHQWVVFVRHSPEYKRVYPEARLPGYWTPFGDELPRGGYFGFPYRAGWEAVRRWYAAGDLRGDYDSNEELLITGWYTLGAPRCADGPRYYFVSWRPQDNEEIPLERIQAEYHHWGSIRVDGRPKIEIYDREPVVGAPRVVDIEDVESVDADVPVAVGQALELPLPERNLGVVFSPAGAAERGQPAVEGNLSQRESTGGAAGVALLIGADVTLRAEPGGAVGVTLLWRSLASVASNASVFVHLIDPATGATVAQADGWPGCGQAPTSEWDSGDLIADPRVLTLPEMLPAGAYRLTAGLYDSETGERWSAQGHAGWSDAADLGAVDIGSDEDDE